MNQYRYYEVETCLECPLRGNWQEYDKDFNSIDKITCWHTSFNDDGKDIPYEVGSKGYNPFPDWCPLSVQNPYQSEWEKVLTNTDIDHILASMSYGCSCLHNSRIRAEDGVRCEKIKKKLDSLRTKGGE